MPPLYWLTVQTVPATSSTDAIVAFAAVRRNFCHGSRGGRSTRRRRTLV